VQIVILAGGVGGSRFIQGACTAFPEADITVVGNTGDDLTRHGLRICPDLDTVMYTLGGGNDQVRGWGRAEESWAVMGELAAYGEQPWFSLGDRDLGTHLVRTGLLAAGHSLSEVTARLCQRWFADLPRLRLLPMSDDPVETQVVIADPDAPGGRRAVHFQDYWVRQHAGPPALSVHQLGLDASRPAPGVLAALAGADLVLVAPSNPVVSIGPILAVPGLREAVRATPAPVLGFAGILGGAPVLGMAHRLLPAIGVATEAAAVGRHYGARSAGGILDVWAMDTADAAGAGSVERAGLRPVITDLLMTDPSTTAAFVHHVIEVGLP
jgi:LPPG:FO 2-phospho-L-lactate transferase